MYNYQTLIEPTGNQTKEGKDEYRVVAQDSSSPVPIHYGSKEECEK